MNPTELHASISSIRVYIIDLFQQVQCKARRLSFLQELGLIKRLYKTTDTVQKIWRAAEELQAIGIEMATTAHNTHPHLIYQDMHISTISLCMVTFVLYNPKLDASMLSDTCENLNIPPHSSIALCVCKQNQSDWKHPLFARVNDGPCNFVDVVCDFSAVCNVRV